MEVRGITIGNFGSHVRIFIGRLEKETASTIQGFPQ